MRASVGAVTPPGVRHPQACGESSSCARHSGTGAPDCFTLLRQARTKVHSRALLALTAHELGHLSAEAAHLIKPGGAVPYLPNRLPVEVANRPAPLDAGVDIAQPGARVTLVEPAPQSLHRRWVSPTPISALGGFLSWAPFPSFVFARSRSRRNRRATPSADGPQPRARGRRCPAG